MQSYIVIAILIAATLPFVVSLLSAFSPATQVKDIEDYFLFDRKLDIDSFIKTTIGYSLQVASITLFFYWTYTYGILGPIVVCTAWAGGYMLVSFALQRTRFDDFLGTGRSDAPPAAETIHGFIGGRMHANNQTLKQRGILAVSLASIIGLGGTMMAEIDYSTQFFTSALQITKPSEFLRLSIELTVLGFTVLYVLWGGYKSAVFTDRFQVPVAYVAFSIFGFSIAALAGGKPDDTGVAYLVIFMVVLFFFLLRRRLKLLQEMLPNDSWDQLTTLFTFVPIIAVGLALLIYLSRTAPGSWTIAALWPILFPPTSVFLGFGYWGTFALIFANGIWQFIDISSLQRLQSFDKQEVTQRRERVAKTLRITGVEAGIGWLLIAVTATILRAAGLKNESFLDSLRTVENSAFSMVIPVFIFTVVVYMLSTISGFISALSYISYYDVVPNVMHRVESRDDLSAPVESRAGLSARLHAARATTVAVIASIFFLYLLLRLVIASSANSDIAVILYAIYAFQVVIFPSALIAIFGGPRILVNPLAVVISVAVGSASAYLSATNASAWSLFSRLGVDEASWTLMPPLVSAISSVLAYIVVSIASSSFFPIRNLLHNRHN